jgi:UDP-N-acetylmuramate: L-alanyl-gamma-D-glutamyl-meso-diaminopimelate ligase
MEKGLGKGDPEGVPLLPPPAHVHIMGICGTAMASLAGMFHESGYRVTGSDQAIYPPMSDFLRDLGISVIDGYRASNLDSAPDLVVVGNVIRKANPEAVQLEMSDIPFTSMPGALDRYFINSKTRIVAAGTHGKTTVSSMIAWILYKQHLDPGFMIGGVPGNFKTNYRLGRGPVFVIEGDEYDTAYFDKSPKFLHYKPQIGVITSCEFDHADIYGSLEEIKDQFRAFAQLIPSNGSLIAYGGDARVLEIIKDCNRPVQTYGAESGMNWHAVKLDEGSDGINALIMRDGQRAAGGTLPVFGFHNVLNATAAVAAAASVGIEPQKALDALGSFRGVRRRQEILGERFGVLLVDDFAHHPTAVKVTCDAIHSRYSDRRLVAVFEPRTNTSRRAIFQELYVNAFLSADLIVLREPGDVARIPEAERFSSERLARDLRRLGKNAQSFDDTDGLLEFLLKELQAGDVVLTMSNGSFDDLNARLLASFKEPRK